MGADGQGWIAEYLPALSTFQRGGPGRSAESELIEDIVMVGQHDMEENTNGIECQAQKPKAHLSIGIIFQKTLYFLR
jgi:hypothetical protein